MQWFLILYVTVCVPYQTEQCAGAAQMVRIEMPSREVCEQIAAVNKDHLPECWAQIIPTAKTEN
jgi:hypothetical protein